MEETKKLSIPKNFFKKLKYKIEVEPTGMVLEKCTIENPCDICKEFITKHENY